MPRVHACVARPSVFATRASTCASRVRASSLPTLELPSVDATREREKSFARALAAASHRYGFFYLTGHGCERACEATLEASRAFFDLPDAAKREIDYRASPCFRGYVADGLENTNGRPDRREQIEFGAEGTYRGRACENHYERLIGPNQWPTADGGRLRREVERFQGEMERVSRRTMRYLALGLGLNEDCFDATFGDAPNVQMKVCRYPPTSDGEFGVGEHSDTGYLSLLVQDDVGGLQVKLPDSDEWIDAPPIPGALVVNLGEMIQFATGGYLIATPHRVRNVAPDFGRARYSVPYFWNPRLDYRVEAMKLPEDLPWCRPKPPSYDSTASHGGTNKVLDCYGENAFKSLARSHREVMERHHGDLQILPDGSVVKRDQATTRV